MGSKVNSFQLELLRRITGLSADLCSEALYKRDGILAFAQEYLENYYLRQGTTVSFPKWDLFQTQLRNFAG